MMITTETHSGTFSVAALLPGLDSFQRGHRQSAEDVWRRHDEELAAFQQHLRNGRQRIRRAFARGETELMLGSFPSALCTDDGRAISDAEDEAERLRNATPAWLATVPAGVRVVYDYWKTHMRQCGFKFSARIIDYVDGKPGNVGMFISWPRRLIEE